MRVVSRKGQARSGRPPDFTMDGEVDLRYSGVAWSWV